MGASGRMDKGSEAGRSSSEFDSGGNSGQIVEDDMMAEACGRS